MKKMSKPTFNVWRQIVLGLFSDVKIIEEHFIDSEEIILTGQAELILRSEAFKISEKGTLLNLYNLTVGELGYKNASYDQIIQRANEFGLEICPDDAAPSLCISDRDIEDIEEGGGLYVAMTPYLDLKNKPNIFVVDDAWLGDDGMFEELRAEPIKKKYQDYCHFLFCQTVQC